MGGFLSRMFACVACFPMKKSQIFLELPRFFGNTSTWQPSEYKLKWAYGIYILSSSLNARCTLKNIHSYNWLRFSGKGSIYILDWSYTVPLFILGNAWQRVGGTSQVMPICVTWPDDVGAVLYLVLSEHPRSCSLIHCFSTALGIPRILLQANKRPKRLTRNSTIVNLTKV